MVTLVTEKQREKIHFLEQREKQIIQMLDEGKTYKEIADTIFLSVKYLKKVISKLLQANNCRNRTELVNMARETGFLTPENKDNGS